MQGFVKLKSPLWKTTCIYAVIAYQMHRKHLTYALVQDIQKGRAASSHSHPTSIPPSSLQQHAGSVSSSFIPIYDEEMAS